MHHCCPLRPDPRTQNTAAAQAQLSAKEQQRREVEQALHARQLQLAQAQRHATNQEHLAAARLVSLDEQVAKVRPLPTFKTGCRKRLRCW